MFTLVFCFFLFFFYIGANELGIARCMCFRCKGEVAKSDHIYAGAGSLNGDCEDGKANDDDAIEADDFNAVSASTGARLRRYVWSHFSWCLCHP